MWLLTAYIIEKLAPLKGKRVNENEWELSIEDLVDLIFAKLWKEAGIALNDSIEELKGELRYLAKLGCISLDGNVIRTNENKLSKLSEKVKNDPLRKVIPLWDEYIKKIDKYISSLKV
jgi:hypothetical protein